MCLTLSFPSWVNERQPGHVLEKRKGLSFSGALETYERNLTMKYGAYLNIRVSLSSVALNVLTDEYSQENDTSFSHL